MRSVRVVLAGLCLWPLAGAALGDEASGLDCFFPQVCSDDGSGCTLTSMVFSLPDQASVVRGTFPEGAVYAVAQVEDSFVTLIVLTSGTAKMTRVERVAGREVARLFHGTCWMTD